ncbi:MAG: hypothetical protein HY703_08010 [Gemmatimonadetes bacterium]|nr:hypothetical protein [Gemmatimonadota bacterium]
MDEALRTRAEERLHQAFQERALGDSRESYRRRLKVLKDRDPAAFQKAVAYYEEILLPRLADPATDPVAEWAEYGRLLAELAGTGRLVEIGANGRARPHAPPAPADHLVLQIPDDPAVPALALSLPLRPTPAQRATYDLLVLGRTTISTP